MARFANYAAIHIGIKSLSRILQSWTDLCKQVLMPHTLQLRPRTECSCSPVDNLHEGTIFIRKTLSFLYSQIDHITASAATLISCLNLTSTLFSQLSKIWAMLLGGYKVEPIWMIDHIEPENWHSKNKWLIVSSLWQKTHLLLPWQFRFARLSLVRITPRRRYHAKTLFFSGIFIDQIFLLLSTGTSGWISALYILSTVNLPLLCKLHRNSSVPCVKLTEPSRCSNSCHAVNLGPTRSLRNVIFGG